MEIRKTIFLRILLLIGCSIFFYPTISDYINNITQSRAIVAYQKSLSQYDGLEIEKIREKAKTYNKKLLNIDHPLSNPSSLEEYKENLDPFKNGMMGTVIIEKINVNLPIYHDVNEGVIQVSVGHLPGTSLPVGGKGTHSVISTHSGLPSAKLFTDLNKLEAGDEFTISVLGDDLTYKIDQIVTVLPHETEALKIDGDKDYVTMFTCTPYGINTHRLLVSGERVIKDTDNKEAETLKKAEKNIKNHLIKMLIFVGIFLIILLTIIKDLVSIVINKKRKV
jgi:sortase A